MPRGGGRRSRPEGRTTRLAFEPQPIEHLSPGRFVAADRIVPGEHAPSGHAPRRALRHRTQKPANIRCQLRCRGGPTLLSARQVERAERAGRRGETGAPCQGIHHLDRDACPALVGNDQDRSPRRQILERIDLRTGHEIASREGKIAHGAHDGAREHDAQPPRAGEPRQDVQEEPPDAADIVVVPAAPQHEVEIAAGRGIAAPAGCAMGLDDLRPGPARRPGRRPAGPDQRRLAGERQDLGVIGRRQVDAACGLRPQRALVGEARVPAVATAGNEGRDAVEVEEVGQHVVRFENDRRGRQAASRGHVLGMIDHGDDGASGNVICRHPVGNRTIGERLGKTADRRCRLEADGPGEAARRDQPLVPLHDQRQMRPLPGLVRPDESAQALAALEAPMWPVLDIDARDAIAAPHQDTRLGFEDRRAADPAPERAEHDRERAEAFADQPPRRFACRISTDAQDRPRDILGPYQACRFRAAAGEGSPLTGCRPLDRQRMERPERRPDRPALSQVLTTGRHAVRVEERDERNIERRVEAEARHEIEQGLQAFRCRLGQQDDLRQASRAPVGASGRKHPDPRQVFARRAGRVPAAPGARPRPLQAAPGKAHGEPPAPEEPPGEPMPPGPQAAADCAAQAAETAFRNP